MKTVWIAALVLLSAPLAVPASAGPASLVLEVSDASIVEGDLGASTLTFQVRRIGSFTGKSQTVSWTTADGDAAAGSDYTAASGTLVFDKKTTVRTVSVQVLGDTDQEPDEYFLVHVTGSGGGDPEGRGRIQNDDGWPPS
jgi:hypothetical protein